MSATPLKVAVTGAAGRWPELDPTRRWLGVVGYPGSDELTLLRIG